LAKKLGPKMLKPGAARAMWVVFVARAQEIFFPTLAPGLRSFLVKIAPLNLDLEMLLVATAFGARWGLLLDPIVER
jgi:hypothetical protein